MVYPLGAPVNAGAALHPPLRETGRAHPSRGIPRLGRCLGGCRGIEAVRGFPKARTVQLEISLRPKLLTVKLTRCCPSEFSFLIRKSRRVFNLRRLYFFLSGLSFLLERYPAFGLSKGRGGGRSAGEEHPNWWSERSFSRRLLFLCGPAPSGQRGCCRYQDHSAKPETPLPKELRLFDILPKPRELRGEAGFPKHAL